MGFRQSLLASASRDSVTASVQGGQKNASSISTYQTVNGSNFVTSQQNKRILYTISFYNLETFHHNKLIDECA